VAALGDSITAGSPLWDPDPAVRAQIPAPDEQSQFEYWAARERPELEFRNCGVLGERTDEIIARLGECAEGADVLVAQGGINDIAQGLPAGVAAEGLRAVVEDGKDAGLEVVLVDVLPWDNGHPAADGAIADLNREIAAIGREEDVEVVPFHDELEDPAVPGTMAPQLTDDGDHPSVEGYRRLGELLAKRLPG
jgi:lysophospholipase L1-like esterase